MNTSTIKNIIFNWAGMLTTIIYAFIMTPFCVHSLGDTSYGLWNLVASCIGYMALLDFGIQTAMNRYFAKYKGLQDINGVNDVYSNSLVLYFFIGTLAFVIGTIIALNIDKIFQIDSKDVVVVWNIMILMTIYTACEFPFNVFGALIVSHQRFDVLNATQIVALCVQAILIWLIFKFDVSLWFFALAIVASGLLRYLLQYVFIHRYIPDLRFKISLVSKKTVMQLLTFSGITFIISIATYLIYKTDNIVIGIYLSPQAITIYSIGFMLSDYITGIVTKMCNTLTPVFSEYDAREQLNESISLLMVSSRFSTLIGVPSGLIAFVFGDEFISLWMGKGYHNAYIITVILMLSRMVGYPTTPMYSMLYGIGKHYLILYTTLVEAFFNIVLSLILVHFYGIIGVAIGTCIPMMAARIIFPIIVAKKIDFNFYDWLIEGVFRPGVCCLIFYFLILFIDRLIISITWNAFILQILLASIIYVLIMWLLGLRKSERKALMLRLRLSVS